MIIEPTKFPNDPANTTPIELSLPVEARKPEKRHYDLTWNR